MEYKVVAEPLIARLQGTIDEILGTVIPAGPVAMVDYPDFSNVGDSAIWLGQSVYLRRRREQHPGYCCSISGYVADALARDAPTGAILICGGGNFGTLWPRHQEFRLELLKRHKGRPIVQMPQSIHFSDDASIAETARAIDRHKAFTLLVRDRASYAFAIRRFDCPVHLCPDMAFYIGRTQRLPADVDLLCLLRTDLETIADRGGPERALSGAAESRVVTDWLDEPRHRLRWTRWLSQARHALASRTRRRAEQFDAVAWSRYRRGAALLSRGRVVVTDRLHAHIMSLLLDIPHVALDNSYGKLGGFIEAWTGEYLNLRRARTIPEALEQARKLLDAVPAQQ
jgi:pyruvyl transferase EpsO